jgi:hypothetical protein
VQKQKKNTQKIYKTKPSKNHYKKKKTTVQAPDTLGTLIIHEDYKMSLRYIKLVITCSSYGDTLNAKQLFKIKKTKNNNNGNSKKEKNWTRLNLFV